MSAKQPPEPSNKLFRVWLLCNSLKKKKQMFCDFKRAFNANASIVNVTTAYEEQIAWD